MASGTGGLPELVLHAARAGDIGLEAWRRPNGSERALLAAVVCPGNPSPQFGCSHAKAPLIAAIVGALRQARVPVVSFDYKGVGMSAPGGANLDPKGWQIPEFQEASESSRKVVEWAKQHISDHIVVCGYSYGSSQALVLALSGAYAYISVSMAYNVYMFIMDEKEKAATKEDMERHSQLQCRALYICGEKDRMTPVDQVQRLTQARSDGGAGAGIQIIKQGGHDLKQKEDEAGGLCADFVLRLQEELAPGVA